MTKKMAIREYKNEDITIIWDSDKCTHAGICWKTLPEVYRPSERPWVKIENATTEELKAQIDQCPSGALIYRENVKEE